MKTQHFQSVGLLAVSYSMVLLSAGIKGSTAQVSCIDAYIGDGACDGHNNVADCGASRVLCGEA